MEKDIFRFGPFDEKSEDENVEKLPEFQMTCTCPKCKKGKLTIKWHIMAVGRSYVLFKIAYKDKDMCNVCGCEFDVSLAGKSGRLLQLQLDNNRP